MSKMDRTLSRTPSDTERKYNLGQLKTAQGSSAKLESQIQQLSQTLAQYMANTNSKLTESSQTWFYSGVPTLENAPAVDWSNEQKATHIGDLYFNEQDGSLYLFKSTNDVYSWVKCASATAETDTYNVTFYSESGVVIASYIIKKDDAINPPVNNVAWVDSEGVAVTFPYTPTSDTNLYIQESTL